MLILRAINMRKWVATVEKTSNGFILTTSEKEKLVFTQKNEGDEFNKDHVIDMLYELLDNFGECGSKHDIRRLKICYVKGDDYEEKDSEEGVEYDFC